MEACDHKGNAEEETSKRERSGAEEQVGSTGELRRGKEWGGRRE